MDFVTLVCKKKKKKNQHKQQLTTLVLWIIFINDSKYQ